MKTMITFEFVALILVLWAFWMESFENKENIKPYDDGFLGGYTFTYNRLKRKKNYGIAVFALGLALMGILLWIWTPLP